MNVVPTCLSLWCSTVVISNKKQILRTHLNSTVEEAVVLSGTIEKSLCVHQVILLIKNCWCRKEVSLVLQQAMLLWLLMIVYRPDCHFYCFVVELSRRNKLSEVSQLTLNHHLELNLNRKRRGLKNQFQKQIFDELIKKVNKLATKKVKIIIGSTAKRICSISHSGNKKKSFEWHKRTVKESSASFSFTNVRHSRFIRFWYLLSSKQ